MLELYDTKDKQSETVINITTRIRTDNCDMFRCYDCYLFASIFRDVNYFGSNFKIIIFFCGYHDSDNYDKINKNNYNSSSSNNNNNNIFFYNFNLHRDYIYRG